MYTETLTMPESLDGSLVRSLASKSLADELGTIADVVIDSAIESGALDGVPIIGMLVGGIKAGRDIRTNLFVRKVYLFLKELSSLPADKRRHFAEQFDTDKERHKFGETVLLLLERAEDMKKPQLIARIMSAHVLGELDLRQAMRLCSIIDRCYTGDLEHLRGFRNGPQGAMTPIAESLFSAGLLSNGGLDGGSADGNDGGVIYCINEFGHMLLKHGLGEVNAEPPSPISVTLRARR